jgi:hypothetical protein
MHRHALAILLLAPLAVWAAEPEPRIELTKEGEAEFFLGDELVARYHMSWELAKPYFWPLNAPGKVPVTRGWPMVKGLPKETADHVHQKSGWFCHGDVIPEGVTVVSSSDKHVKGVDFWSESKGHGRIARMATGTPKGGKTLYVKNEWQDSAATKILDEEQRMSLHPVADGRLIVVDIDLRATVCPITFGDTKEGAFGVRVNDQIRLTAKGEHSQLVNAQGKSGEKDVWGMLSDWCDYSGDIDGKRAGIAVFDAPTNKPRAAWHSRGYGLMAANPFGRAESGFPARKGETDLVKLAKGEHLKLRYGIYLHAGDAKDGKVAEAYEAFSKMK